MWRMHHLLHMRARDADWSRTPLPPCPRCAGTDSFGQVGQGGEAGPYVREPLPVRIGLDGRRVVAIAAGEYHSLAIDEDGAVFGWGANGTGALGTGDRTDSSTPRLVLINPQDRAIAVAGGGAHSLVLLEDGRVLAMGRGRSGQLGRGGALESVAAFRTNPVEVPEFGPGRAAGAAASVAAGRDHSIALVKAPTQQ